MALSKLNIIFGVIIFVIFSILLLNYFNINMNDNNGFNFLQRKAVYEGIGNSLTKKSQGIE